MGWVKEIKQRAEALCWQAEGKRIIKNEESFFDFDIKYHTICTSYYIIIKTMNYSVSQFRANMWAILDETRYERKITTIGRRNKQEFVVIPMDMFMQTGSKELINNLGIDNQANKEPLVNFWKEWIWINEFNEYLSYKQSI